MTGHLLIVEDDEELAGQLALQMSQYGHSAVAVHDGRAALQAVSTNSFDAVILDRMLPKLDGIEVLRCLRDGRVTVPILMLTALGQSTQKVEGLDAGADDYVAKPVDPAELNARTNALIRARKWQGASSDETIRFADIVVSPTRHRAWRNDKTLNLQKTEFKMLTILVQNAGSVVTRSMFLEQVWNYDFEPTTNLVESNMRRLRMKLTEFGATDPIQTVRGVGYMLKA